MSSPLGDTTLGIVKMWEKWGGQRDSNPQQQAPQAWTLPLSYGHQPDRKLVFRPGTVKPSSVSIIKFEFSAGTVGSLRSKSFSI